jgi:NADPH-dependent curcumin reductase CurA
MAAETQCNTVVLAKYAEGAPGEENFALQKISVPHPGPGEIAVRVLILSVDPYMVSWPALGAAA